MARLPRLVVPHQLHHVVQFSVDRQPIFQVAEDYQFFKDTLREAAKKYKVAIFSYVLMPDQVRLLAIPEEEGGLARMMQWVGRHYVPYFNRKYGRMGTLWQGRFKANVVDADGYFFACCRFIELAPVKDGLVREPEEYSWSSYAHHVGVKSDQLLTDHPLFWRLGNTPFDREAGFRKMAQQALTAAEWREIDESVNKAWVLGSDAFKAGLEKQINRQVRPGKRGRPRKPAAPAKAPG